jgi:hypothetical protein
MTIQFTCGCGRTLQVGEEHAGRRAKCPACGKVVRIPVPEALPASDSDLPLAEPAEQPRLSTGTKVAIAAGGAVVVALAVFIPLWLLHDRGGPEAATPPAAEQVAATAGPAEAGPGPQASLATESVAEAPAESDEAPAAEGESPPAPEPSTASPLPRRSPQGEAGVPPPTPEPRRNAPMWARIVLDEGLFPGGTFWAEAEKAYLGASAAGGQAGGRVAVPVAPTLAPSALKNRFGRPELTTADDGKEWDCYGPLAFGLEAHYTDYTWLKAPARFFEQGFRAAALAVCEPATAAPEPTLPRRSPEDEAGPPPLEPAETEPAPPAVEDESAPPAPAETPMPEADAPADEAPDQDAASP